MATPRVTYIPSQTPDESTSTSNRTAVISPLTLFIHDATILLKNLKYLPNLLLPFRIPVHRPGVRYYLAPIIVNEFLLALSILYTVVMFFTGSIAIVLLPGGAFAVFALFAIGICVLLAAPGWSARTVQSRNVKVKANHFPDERWVFMNGVAQSILDLQFTVDNISATFKRPVLGIHNRSMGFVMDIAECLIQRCFGYSSEDVRACYDELKVHLLDPTVNKVVVIAHSQGGIVVSLTIDRMFAELPPAAMAKLEIYTFGSAAAHFNNPLKYSTHAGQQVNRREVQKIVHFGHPHDLAHHHGGELPWLQASHAAVPGTVISNAVPSGDTAVQIVKGTHESDSHVSNLPAILEAAKADIKIARTRGATIGNTPTGPSEALDRNQSIRPSGGREESTDTAPSSPSARPEHLRDAYSHPPYFLNHSSESTGKAAQHRRLFNLSYRNDLLADNDKKAFEIHSKDGTEDQSTFLGRHTHSENEHIIPIIEHYVNEYDMVPRWGVLNHVRNHPQHRYAGHVFINRHIGGHLFNRHYLDAMFPLYPQQQRFLDCVVDVDVPTARARAQSLARSVTMAAEPNPKHHLEKLKDAIAKIPTPSTLVKRIVAWLLLMRMRLMFVSRYGFPKQEKGILKGAVDLMSQKRTGMDLDHVRPDQSLEDKLHAIAGTVERTETEYAIDEGKGRMVRQLSKLWRYMDGGQA
ncbi:MAG: hypothetical protein M1820_006954 [Bogoriella megaspora]|nr:MAG: hypothetical protein M1820_006954 [Bogoriella megaspora]